MNTNSVSKLFLILEIKDKFKIKCQLKRHFDPTLVGRINRSLPLSGNSHMLEKNAIYFGTSIEAGSQRIKKEFKKGDIAFLSVGKAICFFHTDYKTNKNMSIIGKMIGEFELFKNVESGDEIKFYSDTDWYT